MAWGMPAASACSPSRVALALLGCMPTHQSTLLRGRPPATRPSRRRSPAHANILAVHGPDEEDEEDALLGRAASPSDLDLASEPMPPGDVAALHRKVDAFVMRLPLGTDAAAARVESAVATRLLECELAKAQLRQRLQKW